MNLLCRLLGHRWLVYFIPCSDDCQVCKDEGRAWCKRCGAREERE